LRLLAGGLGIFIALAEHYPVVCVPHQGSASYDLAAPIVADT
jgi:hypothetical protein